MRNKCSRAHGVGWLALHFSSYLLMLKGITHNSPLVLVAEVFFSLQIFVALPDPSLLHTALPHYTPQHINHGVVPWFPYDCLVHRTGALGLSGEACAGSTVAGYRFCQLSRCGGLQPVPQSQVGSIPGMFP